MRHAPALPRLGLGASQFGNLYRVTTDEEVEGAIAAAWDGGIRYFDTAPHYGLGLSEQRLGAQLASRPRDDYILSTKVGRLLVPSPETAGLPDSEGFAVPARHRRVWDFSRDGILRSLEGSLERLGVDRIDIVYLHDPDEHGAEALATGIPTLIELRDQGVVGRVGAGMNQSAMLAEFVRRTDIDIVMLAGRFTLLEQGALLDLLPVARDRDVSVVAAAVYNSGMLSRARVAADALYNYAPAPAALIARANAIAEICEAHGVSLPEAAVAYPLLHPAVDSVVVGARTATQVDDALARSGARIPPALWLELTSAGLIPDPYNLEERL